MNNKIQTILPRQRIENGFDLPQLIHTLWSGKWLILLIATLAVFISFIYVFGQSPVYRADALLQVESKKASVPGLEELAGIGGDQASVGTELEIIKSRKIVGEAVTALKLNIIAVPRKIPLISNLYKHFFSPDDIKKPVFYWDMLDEKLHKFAWGNEQVKIERLSVPENWLDHPLTLVAMADNKFKLLSKKQVVIEGDVGRAISSKDHSFSIFISELTGMPGTEYLIKKLSDLNAIEELQNTIQASEQGKRTGIIKLLLEGENKKNIVATLDHIAKTYLEQNKSRSSEEASNALAFLKVQIKPIKEKSEKSEALLKEYRTKNQTADMSLETQAILELAAGIDTDLQKLSLKRDELSQKYTANHPTIRAVALQQQKLEQRKKSTLSKISGLPETQQKLLKLERDFKVANAIYLDLINKIQEFKIAKASSVGNVYIIDSAVVHDQPVKPKIVFLLVLGAVLGLMLGVSVVFLRKALHHSIDNPEKLEEATGLPVYATVPMSKGVKLTGGLKAGNKRQKSLLAAEDPTDPAIESLRSLRTSLHFAMLEASNNIVMITGPSPGIGKSFIASNFAAVLAAGEQRILLVDGDMRKGYVHNLLKRQVSPGLSDLISDSANLEEAINTVELGDHKLDIITRGKTPPNPSELLMHSNFEKLLDRLSSQYDLVLIDTPPVHAVTDPTIVGKLAGVVFMVVRSEMHTMKEIEHAITRLDHMGIETKGFIFNGFVVNKRTGYGSYGYSYYGDYKPDKRDTQGI